MLLEIKKYLIAKKMANLQELSIHFCKEPETIRCMLAHWLRKGKIGRLKNPVGCQIRCHTCRPELAEVYQWIDNTI